MSSKLCNNCLNIEDDFIKDICKKCHNQKNIINSYKRKFGIVLDSKLLFDTHDIIQWYRWTKFEKTPNGKILNQLPRQLITESNIKKITQYVIEDLLKFNTREEKLKLSQKIMGDYKIQFSKTSFILNSPYNLLNLTYPYLEIKKWELSHSGNNTWKDYDIFLEAVRYYYNSLDKDIDINIAFSEEILNIKFNKLLRAKERHYSNVCWNDILKDCGITEKINLNMSYDGIKMGSNQEVIIYNFIHNVLGLKNLKYLGSKRKGKFTYDNNGSKYYPDFVLTELDKPIIIEYFGMYTEKIPNGKFKDVYIEYIKKIKIKENFFSNHNDIYFISLYPSDIKNDFYGVKNKINKFNLKGGEEIGKKITKL